jgi:hypothetical protein
LQKVLFFLSASCGSDYVGNYGFGRLIRPLCLEAVEMFQKQTEADMSLEMQKKKDGSLRSKWWYGRFTVNSKSSFENLGIEIKVGEPSV